MTASVYSQKFHVASWLRLLGSITPGKSYTSYRWWLFNMPALPWRKSTSLKIKTKALRWTFCICRFPDAHLDARSVVLGLLNPPLCGRKVLLIRLPKLFRCWLQILKMMAFGEVPILGWLQGWKQLCQEVSFCCRSLQSSVPQCCVMQNLFF